MEALNNKMMQTKNLQVNKTTEMKTIGGKF